VERYIALLQEPWCFTVEQVSQMTLWQLEYLYFRPAIRNAKRARGESDLDDMPDQPTRKFTVPTKEEFVAAAMNEIGGTRAEWERQYDEAMKADGR